MRLLDSDEVRPQDLLAIDKVPKNEVSVGNHCEPSQEGSRRAALGMRLPPLGLRAQELERLEKSLALFRAGCPCQEATC
eukprot:8105001-Pyramimonas_sp.AAC.1